MLNQLALILAVATLQAPSKATSPRPAAGAQALLARIKTTYQDRSVEAEFSQTYVDSVTGPKATETGMLWARGDGPVRFDYQAPETKHFVFDGKTAYFYEPQAAQVTLITDFAQGPAAKSLAFLWGHGALDEAFTSALCTTACPKAEAFETVVTLWPKAPLPGVDRVDLVIDTARAEVHETHLTDALGNRTRYTLTKRKLGGVIDPSRFVFTVPEGVSVLRTALEGPKDEAPAEVVTPKAP